MRKLRIAVLSCGGLVHVEAYLAYFQQRGHEVVWLPYDRPARALAVPTVDVSHGARARNPWTKWRYVLAGVTARSLLRRLEPDVVHGHYATSAGLICLLSGFRPFVVTAHGSDLIATRRSPLRRSLLRAALGRAALVNTVSEQLREVALGLAVPAEKILVAAVGVDTRELDFLAPAAILPPARLLCTRTLADVYDPVSIVRACALARQRGHRLTLTFAAAGPLEARLRALVGELGMTADVRFLGGYSHSELPGLLHAHDLYVSASRWDGTSLSLLEAMAAGLPPVVSRTPSNLEWLADGKSALMFTCGDIEDMAGSLGRAVSDERWRREAAARNRETAVRRGDRTTNLRRLEARLVEIVERNEAQ